MAKKFCKKLMIVIIISVVLLLNNNLEVFAFLPLTHKKITEEVAKRENLPPVETEIYASGSILSDIGRLSFDHSTAAVNDEKIDSDGQKFTEALETIALGSFSSEVQLFAQGWREHYIQDQKGDARSVFGSEVSYYNAIVRIDKCLFTGNVDYSFYINAELIKQTYAHFGLKLSESQVYAEILKMAILEKFALHCDLSSGITETDRAAVNSEIARVANLCGESLSGINPLKTKHIEQSSNSYPKIIQVDFNQLGLIKGILEFCHLENSGKFGDLLKVNFVIDEEDEFYRFIINSTQRF